MVRFLQLVAGAVLAQVDGMPSPACAEITCGQLKCIPPLQPIRKQGCCPICTAPDHILPLDRHKAVHNPFTRAVAKKAPANCKGAKCFQLQCKSGEVFEHQGDDCCPRCHLSSAGTGVTKPEGAGEFELDEAGGEEAPPAMSTGTGEKMPPGMSTGTGTGEAMP
eukprot:CAMPEP_0204254810 /NCGR_PEP_ID=MMETSP0468-20130131/2797_1 /ASSEMBLY_ACC=CAM_ASM_000383 /TAXON_ID=2969 /ORGANISM="Oxyrrhis marina" /LENGTH=163 /DNA_ID=CAMNT_0051228601 /DNA_START=27 /DNA_END=514 /DNA_ORIENTATION=+